MLVLSIYIVTNVGSHKSRLDLVVSLVGIDNPGQGLNLDLIGRGRILVLHQTRLLFLSSSLLAGSLVVMRGPTTVVTVSGTTDKGAPQVHDGSANGHTDALRVEMLETVKRKPCKYN